MTHGSLHPDSVADRKFRQEAAERAKNLLREYLLQTGLPISEIADRRVDELVDAIVNAARGLK